MVQELGVQQGEGHRQVRRKVSWHKDYLSAWAKRPRLFPGGTEFGCTSWPTLRCKCYSSHFEIPCLISYVLQHLSVRTVVLRAKTLS